MKTKLLGSEKTIDLPQIFQSNVRQDIVKKVYLAALKKQAYAPYLLAGKGSSQHKQSHGRRKFKTLYGKGIARGPRKTMSRRGDQFHWVGTFNPETVKGRAAHPPKIEKRKKFINKKEKLLAIKSCIAGSASKDILKMNYTKTNLEKINFPIIVESSFIEKKLKEIILILKNQGLYKDIKKKVRAGKGKNRGRKYKNTKKILFIISEKENPKKIKNFFETSKVSQLNVQNISLNGRAGKLAIYTEAAIKDIENKFKE